MTILAVLRSGSAQAGLVLPVLGVPVHLPSILVWGAVATLLLTGLMYSGQELGLSRMGIPFLLGSVFTRDRRWAKVIGFAVHGTMGFVFAFLYAVMFEMMGRSGLWLGAGMGLVHGFLLLTLGMAGLPLLHPRMSGERDGPTTTRWLQPPGFMAMNYGRRTPLVALFAHLVFGLILGAGYQLI